MEKFNKDHKGFSGIELLLVLIVIILLGVAGWYVYKEHYRTTTSPPKSSVNVVNTFRVQKLGIEIVNVPTSLRGLIYTTSSSTSVTFGNSLSTPVTSISANFSTNSLMSLDSNCSDSQDNLALGGLTKTTGEYIKPNTESPDGFIFIKQFNGFYITGSYPQFGCAYHGSTTSNTKEAQTLQVTQISAFWALVQNSSDIQLLQN